MAKSARPIMAAARDSAEKAAASAGAFTEGRGSNQGNTQNEKSLYHQSSIDFRCYLEMAFFEPRPNKGF